MVPAFRHLDAVCIGFLGLLASFGYDITGTVIADTVSVSVVSAVQLFHLRPRPSGISFRIAKHLFGLGGIRVKVGIGSIEACPFPTIDYAVVVCGRGVVAKHLLAGILAVNVPPLGIVLPHRLTQVIGHPRRQIVIVELEQPGYVLRSSD